LRQKMPNGVDEGLILVSQLSSSSLALPCCVFFLGNIG
jgi:hypothetical protein